MPEGPEIRRMVDDINAAVAGETTQRVFFAFESLKAREDLLTGRRICEVTARGKAVLMHFGGAPGAARDNGADDQWTVYSHNQLYGKW